MNFLQRLNSFENDVDFRKGWRIALALSAVVLSIGIFSLTTNGLNLGIDFRGGTGWVFPANNTGTETIKSALTSVGVEDSTVQRLEMDGRVTIRVEIGTDADADEAAAAMAKASNQSVDVVNASRSDVGPSWGKDVSNKALRALIVFFIAIALYISWKLEWRMAAGALLAVIHDIIISVGVYAIFGFSVTPGTVVAFLTILGYSLYDTIVVYDKVRENQSKVTHQGDMTYSEMMNLSLNQAFMRSINTTISTVIPVVSILLIGSGIMGAVALQEFGLALFVGLLVGAYSSLFIAAPAVVWLKNREPRNRAISERVMSKRTVSGQNSSSTTTSESEDVQAVDLQESVPSQSQRPREGAPTAPSGGAGSMTSPYSAKHPPRPRKQGKKR